MGLGAKQSPVVERCGALRGTPFQAVREYSKHLKVAPSAVEWDLHHPMRDI